MNDPVRQIPFSYAKLISAPELTIMHFTRRQLAMATNCVVCVEDEPEMIDLVRLILAKEGFEVVGVSGGLEGLATIERLQPDLVLLDLMMPDMDGWEVYRRMKANPTISSIPVIVVTAKAQSIDKVLGLQVAKVDDYITKPFGPAQLLKSIEKVLARDL
jgi:DNA-binding response OmpR family regulator